MQSEEGEWRFPSSEERKQRGGKDERQTRDDYFRVRKGRGVGTDKGTTRHRDGKAAIKLKTIFK